MNDISNRRPAASGRAALAALALGAICAFATQAKADTITDFSLQGTFQYTSPPENTYPLSGGITVDTTTGAVIGQTIYTGGPPFTITTSQGYDAAAQSYYYDVEPFFGEYFIYFNVPSLVNYTGGALASLDDPTPGGAVSYEVAMLVPTADLVSGTATAQNVPEPQTLGLLGVGLLGLAMVATRRRPA